MHIKVWEDFVCPYCYIGMKNLEDAAAELGITPEVEVLSFELEPERDPEKAENWADSLAEYFGGDREKALQGMTHSVGMAEDCGLEVNIDIAMISSTHEAQRLLQYAKRQSLALGKAFFKRAQLAFFNEGAKLNDKETLLRLAAEAGLDRDEAAAVLREKRFEEEIAAEQRAAEERRIDYIPYAVFPSGQSIQGVLTKKDFLEALRKEVDKMA